MLAKNSTALGLECLAKQEWPKTPLATAPHDKSCPDFGLIKRTCVAPAAIKFDLVLILTEKEKRNQFLLGLKINHRLPNCPKDEDVGFGRPLGKTRRTKLTSQLGAFFMAKSCTVT